MSSRNPVTSALEKEDKTDVSKMKDEKLGGIQNDLHKVESMLHSCCWLCFLFINLIYFAMILLLYCWTPIAE